MPGLSATEQANNAVKELMHILKDIGPQTPFTIRESQLHAINILGNLFNTIQPKKIQTTVLPKEVPMIAPTRVSVTVPSPRVPETVTPPRLVIPRSPMISQEYPIENSRQRDIV